MRFLTDAFTRLLKPLLLQGLLVFLAVSGHPQSVGPGIGAGTKDPKDILTKSAAALKRSRRLEYSASYRGSGAFSTRTPTVTGTVLLERLSENDPLVTKISAKGESYAI